MSGQDAGQRPAQATGEFYSISDEQVQREYVQVRRANKWVPFFLPHLKPGMSVLDCGCGVGTITMDLAEIVAPGEVVGIDRDETQLAHARMLAGQRGITNVTFETSNIYQLGYPDASFDAVLAHTVLIHLSDHLGALREMRRVLAPEGIIAISDDDYNTFAISPDNSVVHRAFKIWEQYMILNGGDPHYSRHLRRLLLEAGFAETEGHVVAADYYGTLEETRRFAGLARRILTTPEFTKAALDHRWMDQSQLETMRSELHAWGERPDAFLAVMYCAALGWVTARNR